MILPNYIRKRCGSLLTLGGLNEEIGEKPFLGVGGNDIGMKCGEMNA